MKAAKYIAFIPAFLILINCPAQENLMGFRSGFSYHYGYITAHRNDLAVLVKDYTRIAEFNFSKQFSGTNDWHVKFNYPRFGGSLMYFDFGNPEQLGRGLSLMAYMDFPLLRASRFELLFKIGFGPGYVEKVFDIEDNYKNYAVSTHFNGFAFGNLHTSYDFGKRISVSAGISISHFSNASAKKPNLGMNIPALNGGIAYRFYEVEKKNRAEDYSFTYDKNWKQDLVLAGGRKRKEIEGDAHGTASLAYSISRNFTFKSRVGGGADLFYNTAHDGEEKKGGGEISGAGDILQAGLNVSYIFQVENLGIFINQGVYVYTRYDGDGYIYHRFGLRYIFLDHLIINLSMKTHFAVADHVECGLGYRF